ncbi:hypothetical protein ACOACO_14335 [Nocardioides sp. CPCC 205120]|uniref:hypothetical protein n=1 Tax=Nocardioides sp. CPCC 205120 TaxID=3406462 RepID=UPI003B5150D9
MNDRRTVVGVAALAALAVLLRLPFLGAPTGSDEAGFLLVAHQWHDGASLYGDYWVDRPPLLLALFALVPDVTGLRLLGCACAASVVALCALAAGAAVDPARSRRAALAAAATAALLCSAPWLGTVRVNGEVLAAPFVAGALALTVLALREDARRPLVLAAAAGVLAACGVGVKQSSVDGVVFGTVALLVLALVRPARRRAAAVLLGVAVAGAVVTAALLVGAATLRGTDPLALFDAVVTFRVDAGETIRSSASGATTERLVVLLGTWAVSGLAVLGVAALVLAARRRTDPVAVATAATIVVGSLVALLGGSYWAHYLLQLVPASALAAGLVAARLSVPVVRACVAVLAGVTAVPVVLNLVSGVGEGSRAEAVGGAIAQAAEPGDTAVVAYGQPNVLAGAGLASPYPYLWSLPVRVLDPDLSELTTTVRSPDAPTWVVEWSPGFDSWALDAHELARAVASRYERVAEVCGRGVWRLREVDRAPVPSVPAEECS